MWKDPIVEETRQLREEMAREFNNDPEAIFAYIRTRQDKANRQVITREPRPVRQKKEIT